jgi:hypothetical protein
MICSLNLIIKFLVLRSVRFVIAVHPVAVAFLVDPTSCILPVVASAAHFRLCGESAA